MKSQYYDWDMKSIINGLEVEIRATEKCMDKDRDYDSKGRKLLENQIMMMVAIRATIEKLLDSKIIS